MAIKLGKKNFLSSYEGIQGFTYKLDSIHDLLIKKIQISDPLQDVSSIKIELIEIPSNHLVLLNTEFKIQLTLHPNDDAFLN